MSPFMFFAYHLFQRPNQFNTILCRGRLFQQYVVYQLCKVDSESLEYLHHNQISLRAADGTSLCEQPGDPGTTKNEVDAERSGRLFNLPSTCVRYDQYMRQNMHDITSISNKAGYPDTFLTMTCNPQWLENKNALLPSQSVIDCPDIAARVFRIKLRALMAFVIDEPVFREVKAHDRVI